MKTFLELYIKGKFRDRIQIKSSKHLKRIYSHFKNLASQTNLQWEIHLVKSNIPIRDITKEDMYKWNKKFHPNWYKKNKKYLPEETRDLKRVELDIKEIEIKNYY